MELFIGLHLQYSFGQVLGGVYSSSREEARTILGALLS